MFMLHGRLAALPGKRDQLLPILLEADSSEPMTGCRLYTVALDETDPDGVWVTEIWESEKFHRASLEIAAVRERIGRALPLIDRAGIQQQRLEAIGGIPAAG